MPQGMQIVADVIVPVRGFHIYVTRFLAIDRRWWEHFHEVRKADSAPLHDLTPALDAFELQHLFIMLKPRNKIFELQQQTRRRRGPGGELLSPASSRPRAFLPVWFSSCSVFCCMPSGAILIDDILLGSVLVSCP